MAATYPEKHVYDVAGFPKILGQKLVAHYGCMSCHAINGTETFTSPCANLSDWGQKALSQIAFEFLDHHKIESMPNAEHVAIPMVNGLSSEVTKVLAEPTTSVPLCEFPKLNESAAP